MILRFILLVLVLIPASSFAETIVVRSGEHVDFSRLVLRFKTEPEWTFGRVEGGYEFRVASTDVELDVSHVFDLIPRSRIMTTREVAPGTLFIGVTCSCKADAFELRNGRIVLDIKDGKPDQFSEFENALPSRPENGQPQTFSHNDSRIDFFGERTLRFSQVENHPVEIETAAPPIGGPTGPMQTAETSRLATLDRHKNIDTGDAPDQVKSAKFVDPFGNTRSRVPEIAAEPADRDAPNNHSGFGYIQLDRLLLDQSRSKYTELAQNALLNQLQRAAAQGVLSLPSPKILAHELKYAEPDNALSATNPTDFIEVPTGSRADEVTDHMRIETVIDRDSILAQATPLTINNNGLNCLPEKWFDVRGWGTVSDNQSPYGTLRSELLAEFDLPDRNAINKLIKRQIFLGFGAEAKQLMATFDADSPEDQIMVELAEVLDREFTSLPKNLRSQISCQNDAALWAVLAYDRIPAGVNLYPKSIIRTFSGLPIHLRQHLGPRLVQRFLDADDRSSATTLRNMIDRALQSSDDNFELIETRLAAQAGDTDEIIERVDSVISGNSPAAAHVLLELLETQLAMGIQMRTTDVNLADAFAVEYRGTEVGTRLLQAAILGFAATGNVPAAFARLSAATEYQWLQNGILENLRATLHTKNAEVSTDEQFLKIVFSRKPDHIGNSKLAKQAHYQISARLTDLGFLDRARQILQHSAEDWTAKERLLLARISLEDGSPDLAIQLVSGENRPEAQLIRATAMELKQEFVGSARIYKTLGLVDAQESAAWLASDFRQVVSIGTSAKSRLANLVLGQDNIAKETEDDFSETGDVDMNRPSEITLSNGRRLLEKSNAARKVLGELLE